MFFCFGLIYFAEGRTDLLLNIFLQYLHVKHYMAQVHAQCLIYKKNCTHIYTQEGVVCATKGTNDF